MPVAPKRNNAQHQPLTTVLRNIIREYPAGGGVLRELCQNADDAGATAVEFILDRRTYKTEDILHPGLAEFQGPSLLACNNSKFSATDFESLSRIGDSAKATDLSATGKFGRGFNSVYNWTDMPSILSGESLLILDPHFTWSREVSATDPGGPVYDFVEAYKEPEPDMRNQLTSFGSLLQDFENGYEGTIIRLPLRTKDQAKKSKIVPDKATTEEEIIEVFKMFSSEMVESLLFLRNVHTITLRIDDDIYAKAASTTDQDAKAVINKGYAKIFVEESAGSCEADFLADITLYRGDAAVGYKSGNTENFKYAISHHLGNPPEELREWSRKQKLFPWIAVAAPLEGATDFTGRLFSILPLPVRTKHPVHIHGLFSITPDRSNIHTGGDWTISGDSETKLGADWNRWLFQQCLPGTWIRNLKFLDDMCQNKKAKFAGWQFWPAGIQGVERDLWMGVLGILFVKVLRENMKLLPTVCGYTGTRNDVLFTLNIEEKYMKALEVAGSPISYPPEDRRSELINIGIESQGLTRLNPDTARNSLSKLSGSLGNLPIDPRMILLEYILSDKHYERIGNCHAPLLPVSGGRFCSFNDADGSKLYFPRTGEEAELFKESTRMIDVEKLPVSIKRQMESDIRKLDRSTAISIWRIADAVSYCQEYIFDTVKSKNEDTITIPNFSDFVNRFWKWTKLVDNTLQLNAHPQILDGLWLIPIMGGRYQRISEGKISILDTSSRQYIGKFLHSAASALYDRHGIRYPIYTGEASTKTTTEVLLARRYIQDCELVSFLTDWLVANSKDFVDRLSDMEKAELLQRLTALTRGTASWNKGSLQIVRKLSLFREVVNIALPNVNRPWISLDPVRDNRPMEYIAIRDIPVVLSAPNTIFIDISDNDSDQLIRGLQLAECPSRKQIIDTYVVPNILETKDDTLRNSLVEFALKRFADLSVESRNRLSSAEIVPVGTAFRRPRDTLCLELAIFCFPDENLTPVLEFYNQYHSELAMLGMPVRLTQTFVYERIKVYSQPGRSPKDVKERVLKLLGRFKPWVGGKLPQEHLNHRWLPAAQFPDGVEELFSVEECRDQSFGPLLKYAMPLTDFVMDVSWKVAFGWDKSLSKEQILRQLAGAVKAKDTTALRDLITAGGENLDYCKPELQELEWIPDKDKTKYFRPSDIFLGDYPDLSPYFGTVSSKLRKTPGKDFLVKMGVNRQPSFRQLKELQDQLAAKGVLEEADLRVALFIVKEVGEKFAGEDHSDFKAPDDVGALRLLGDLTAGDPGPEEKERAILHPRVSLATIKQLRLATFHDRLLEFLTDPDFEDDFAQRESSITVIKDTLKRYTPSSTFNEYLANAEDCGSATKISWVLDNTNSYSGAKLLVEELREVQGPALFCCNDGTFTKKDFKAVIDVGVGSKRDDYSKIGKFGRGALTMYHWTSVPSFISGDSFVIFDPEQKYLPVHPITRKPRAGMKLKLRDVRLKYPDQLRPFEGIFGFDENTTSFPGTIFRFPLRPLTAPSALKDSNIDSGKTHRQYLTDYYQDAIDSLLFLENITSISFREIPQPNIIQGLLRGKPSNELVWEVSSEKVHAPKNPRIKEVTITGQFKKAPPGDPSTSHKWCVISGKKSEEDLMTAEGSLVKIQMRDRLEARYGLAALINKTIDFRGKNYMSLPLRKPTTMEIPVHVDANLAVQSNRQSIPLEDSEMEEGSEWNQWIFEMGVAPLYLVLIKHLMQDYGADGYHYWPPHPSENSDSVSKIISTAFWQRVASMPYTLYPPEPLKDARETPQNIEFKEAIFNLLEEGNGKFLVDLLLQFKLHNIVSPPQRIREDLKTCNPGSMKSLSPVYLSDFFRSTAQTDRLFQIWRENHQYDISFFNRLLTFIVSKETLEHVIGCTLLPLANNTLGPLLPKSPGTPNFLVTKTPDERDIMGISPNIAVHPDLEPKLIEKLMSTNELNIAVFQFEDIPRLYKMIDERNTDYRKTWIKKVWSYFEHCIRQSPEKEAAYLSILDQLHVYFGTPIGKPDSHIEFLSPVQFSAGTVPAILKQTGLNGPQNLILKSLTGLIILDPSAFPQKDLPSERMHDISGTRGVLRLLRSIQRLGNGMTAEEYTIKTLQRNEIEALRDLLHPSMIELLLKSHPESAPYLKQLPIWPSESGQLNLYKSATNAIIAPDYDISFTDLTENDPFIQSAVVVKYTNQLASLGVKKMTLDELLRNEVRIGEAIENAKIPKYKSFLSSLHRRNPNAFSKYPLAVDGNGNYCMTNSLYDHTKKVFLAAFRDKKSHFLHSGLQSLNFWRSAGLRQEPTESYFMECTQSLERRKRELAPLEDEQLVTDARVVFEYLVWDTQGMQSWSNGTWAALHRTPVAPALTEFGNHPEYRKPQMRSILQNSSFTTLLRAVTSDHENIAWSQCPILKHKLGSVVLSRIPNSGFPPTETVLNHLNFLSENRSSVAQQEIRRYVADIRSCYLYLQDRLSSIRSPDGKAEIWFNVDADDINTMDQSTFRKSWRCAEALCGGLKYDSMQIQYVRTFLIPFADLLDRYGVEKHVPPVAPPAPVISTDGPVLMLAACQRFRRGRKLIDVVLEVECEKIDAHRIILAAASSVLETMFTGEFQERNRTTIPLPELKARTVKAVVEYIYTGEISGLGHWDDPSEDLQDLIYQLELSDMWDLGDLKAKLADTLCRGEWIRPETVRIILECARDVRAYALERVCERYISDNSRIVQRESLES